MFTAPNAHMRTLLTDRQTDRDTQREAGGGGVQKWTEGEQSLCGSDSHVLTCPGCTRRISFIDLSQGPVKVKPRNAFETER